MPLVGGPGSILEPSLFTLDYILQRRRWMDAAAPDLGQLLSSSTNRRSAAPTGRGHARVPGSYDTVAAGMLEGERCPELRRAL